MNAYIAGEIAALNLDESVEENWIRIKIRSADGETRWLSIDREDVPKIARLLSDIYDRNEKAGR